MSRAAEVRAAVRPYAALLEAYLRGDADILTTFFQYNRLWVNDAFPFPHDVFVLLDHAWTWMEDYYPDTDPIEEVDAVIREVAKGLRGIVR